ncbi:DUF6093 family protein [Micromonospora chersina]|uniref:DUF6093 family protein n=1 Tax=Micromonospora chersina TaxID=47854 RepID=UPI0033E1AA9A
MLDALLAQGQAAAEELMVDRCLIRRKTGETTDDDGNITPTYVTVYDGKCRLKQPAALARADETGEAAQLILRRELQLPMTAVGVQVDDEAKMTAVRYDPDLVNRSLLVRGLHHATHAVMRRLHVEERAS